MRIVINLKKIIEEHLSFLENEHNIELELENTEVSNQVEEQVNIEDYEVTFWEKENE